MMVGLFYTMPVGESFVLHTSCLELYFELGGLTLVKEHLIGGDT